MRGSLRGFRIDREQAIKAGALIGLAVLGITTLPGLLKTPEPPPIPANVGFRPADMNSSAAGPAPEKQARQEAKASQMRLETRRRQERLADRRRRDRAAARKRREAKAMRSDEARKAEPENPSGAPEAQVTTPPVPASPPPPYVPAPVPASVPAPAPPPPDPAPAPPADGSQEFAPR